MTKIFLRATSLASFALLTACAGIDPKNVGQGQYLQYVQGDAVLLESEAPKAGFQNCSNSAYQAMQSNKALEGHLKCAAVATAQPLPFTYRARSLATTAADHVLPSSPYIVRTKTSFICAQSMGEVRKQEKMEIVEDHCDFTNSTVPTAPAMPTSAAPSSASAPRRYFGMTANGELMAQLAWRSEAECLEYARATGEILKANKGAADIKVRCSNIDASTQLKFSAVAKDELLGSDLAVAAKTDLLCLSAITELGKEKVAGLERMRFTVPAACVSR